ncbi:Protein transport protein Bos1 [Malassezia pachydermatis]
MNSLFNLASRQSAAIHADLDKYKADPSAGSSMRAQIMAALSALVKTIEDYEAMAKRELVIAKREKALARASNFHSEVKQLREELACIDAQTRSQPTAVAHNMAPMSTTARARTIDTSQGGSEPMPRMAMQPTYTAPTMPTSFAPPSMMPNSFQFAPPSHDPLAAYRMHQTNGEMYTGEDRPYSMRETHALREHSFIQNTEAQLDAFIAQGRSVLGNLVEQRSILKGTRKRLLDAANTVGLSRELIGFIDRMSTQDTIIFFVGAAFTLFAFCMYHQDTDSKT